MQATRYRDARRTACAAPDSTRIPIRNGTVSLTGVICLAINHGRLYVTDGLGADRRSDSFGRSAGIRRVVVRGTAGATSWAVLAWLDGIGASLVVLGFDGDVLAAWGPTGLNEASLRRSQAKAAGTRVGLAILRRGLHAKLRRQESLVRRVEPASPAADRIAGLRALVDETEEIDALRRVEAAAAGLFWGVLAPLPVRFARRDVDRIPPTWLTVGPRASAITGSGRRATTAAHAALNVLLAVAESECTIALRTVGLDPGLSFSLSHTDQGSRPSASLDCLDAAARGEVEAWWLTLLERHTFGARSFRELPDGSVRVGSELMSELVRTGPLWRQAVAPHVEWIAQTLADAAELPRRLPTRLTEAARSGGRDGIRTDPRRPKRAPAAPTRSCPECGARVVGDRLYCAACSPTMDAEHDARFLAAGMAALARRRAKGESPGHGGEAGRRRGRTNAAHVKAAADWNRDNAERPDPATFAAEILPALRAVPATRIARATGLSLAYAAAIKRGEIVAHPRWWQTIRELSAVDSQE
jgi:CRISPR/Cas system-associated endonuclease Cas1